MMEALIFGYLFLGLATIGLCWAVSVVFLKPKSQEKIVEEKEKPRKEKEKGNKKSKNVSEKPAAKVKSQQPRSRTTSTSTEAKEVHPWQAAVFKGHRDSVTAVDWSSNGKFLASCSKDNTILIWFAKDILSKDHRSIRVNLPFDSATNICWSPDSTAFIISREEEKFVEVYKLGKKSEGSLITVNSLAKFRNVHDDLIVGLGISCGGTYIMSCSRDGNLVLWDLKGTVLERVSIPGGNVNAAKVSPCGRYIAACGLDCMMFEVKFNTSKTYQMTKVYGALKGHESAVSGIDFNPDSTRIATVTKTGTWRVFDTTGNRVNVVCAGKIPMDVSSGDDEDLPTVAMSPDGRIVAVGHGNQVYLFRFKLVAFLSVDVSWTIPVENVKTILFSTDGKYLVTGGSRMIYAFHNVCGYIVQAEELTKRIQDASNNSALKTRLMQELKRITDEVKSLNLTDLKEFELN